MNHQPRVQDLDNPKPCYECNRDRYILYFLEETGKYLCMFCLKNSIDIINQMKDKGDFIAGRSSYL